MEDVPPSYQSAIDREAWNVIARWIPSSDLCSACLVSRKWHSIFVPFLWGDPASHFGIENDAVYVALTRFKRTLRKVRKSVRNLTHTLHLPPALSEIYGGPNPTWLRDVLENLPNLQSLIVSRLPFFDHHSLVALRNSPKDRRRSLEGAEQEGEVSVYGLKLLLAAHEPNTTSIGIAAALPCFQALVYLDLSYTTPARDAAVLSTLSNLYDLQVLKLRGVGLRDGEAEVLANAIGIRVRLLDLRENFLTDMAVRSLMQACFLPPDLHRNGTRLNTRHVEDWPVGIAPGPDYFSLDMLRNEELDHELLKQLTNPLTGRLAFEDIPHRGLTHLYISDNNLSVEGLNSLLKSERLHVLDGGTVDTVKTIARKQSLSSPTGYIDTVRFPGAEKLVPVLVKSASKNLTYLRIDHALITTKLEVNEEVPMPRKSVAEVSGSLSITAELFAQAGQTILEAPAPAHHPVEMPSEREPIYEMDATPAQPRYELVGDMMQFAISPPVGDKPEDPGSLSDAVLSPVRGEGAYAPEVVTNDNDRTSQSSSDEGIVLNASGTGMTSKKPQELRKRFSFEEVDSPSPPNSPRPVLAPTTHDAASFLPSPSVHRQSRIENLLRKRPAALASLQSNSSIRTNTQFLSAFHPSALPNLRTLILTSVPLSVPKSSPLLNAIISFISACADEAALALLRAQTNYSLPPGRARHVAELEHAKTLFALRQITLEMAPPGQALQSAGVSAGQQARGWHNNKSHHVMSKSSTGDRDSENLWSAAKNDFSFFGEEGEEQDECGIYEHDPEKYFPTAHQDEKMVLSPEDSREESWAGGGRASPHRSTYSNGSGSLSPAGSGSGMSPMASATVWKSPRELPLGRNPRRSSGSGERPKSAGLLQGTLMRGQTSGVAEMQGSVPKQAPTSNPAQSQLGRRGTQQQVTKPEEPMIDLVSEIANWRRERKKAYEDAVGRWRMQKTNGSRGLGGGAAGGEVDERDMPFVEGHWKGAISVVKNAAPKGRTGVVDHYGNYFEKGYLYP